MKSIMWRQFLYFCIIIFLTIPILTLIANREVKRHYLKLMENQLKQQATLAGEVVGDLMVSGDFKAIRDITEKMGERTGSRITVIDLDGTVLGDTDEDPLHMENHSDRPEIVSALEYGYGKSLRYSNTLKTDMLYVALPVKKNGESVGVLRVSMLLSSIKELSGAINRKILYSSAIITIFALIFAFISAGVITKPVKNMTEAAKRIARGDFNTRFFVKSKNELSELSEALNKMTFEIQSLFTTLRKERKEVEAIISAMIDGLIVLDHQGKIIMVNESFKNMFNIPAQESIKGKFYWEAFRNKDFKEFFEHMQRSGKTGMIEIKFMDKVYMGNGVQISRKNDSRGNFVIVLRDITEIKNLEKVKADLVANVSHELRTPLTAIKGFVETIEEDAKPDQLHFLQIIKRHTDRLINIVSDLLLLSRLEDAEQKIEMEAVDVKALFESVFKIFEDRICKKGLTWEFNLPEDIRKIRADSFLLEQLLINLIENAVNYTEKGGIQVDLKRTGDEIKLKVSDTGNGIPEEHLPRIFERFYVVDKARSRELGGTGLGLSIVKHIVMVHNGTLDVLSEPGKGTTFNITLPV
ncbi:MAG: ATP-binding protein [Fidelibacterota bacterium]